MTLATEDHISSLGLVISVNVDFNYYFYANLNHFDFEKPNGLQSIMKSLLLLIQLE